MPQRIIGINPKSSIFRPVPAKINMYFNIIRIRVIKSIHNKSMTAITIIPICFSLHRYSENHLALNV